jgi:hypothetical protein
MTRHWAADGPWVMVMSCAASRQCEVLPVASVHDGVMIGSQRACDQVLGLDAILIGTGAVPQLLIRSQSSCDRIMTSRECCIVAIDGVPWLTGMPTG